MTLKRKLEVEIDCDESFSPPMKRAMKQLRVTPIQSSETQSEDVAMDGTSFEPLSASTGSDSSGSPPYPAFNLYPFPSYDSGDVQMGVVNNTYVQTASESRTSSNVSEGSKPCIGLMQPKTSFVHNVSNCYQIPRLRVSCESSIGGSRTLWTQCDQCGAIDMIDTY